MFTYVIEPSLTLSNHFFESLYIFNFCELSWFLNVSPHQELVMTHYSITTQARNPQKALIIYY